MTYSTPAPSITADTPDRFAFGKNWANFLKTLNEHRIEEAVKSLKEKLGVDSLAGKTFLDIGSGSGLFSLAAHRLGAQVFSFDYDTDSVGCTQYLQTTYGISGQPWSVEQGSVLNPEFLKKFGPVDIVYSWGVLHHTGNMYQAFQNVVPLVKDGGKLFISIYNDQGSASRRWLWVKRKYQGASGVGKATLYFYTLLRQWSITFVKDMLKTGNPFKTWNSYFLNRGMSPWHDVVDWVGGYPFEVSKPEEVFDYFHAQGFQLQRLRTCAGGLGCNEYVFVRRT